MEGGKQQLYKTHLTFITEGCGSEDVFSLKKKKKNCSSCNICSALFAYVLKSLVCEEYHLDKKQSFVEAPQGQQEGPLCEAGLMDVLAAIGWLKRAFSRCLSSK